MTKMLNRLHTDENVWNATIRRINQLYDRFDRVVVSFSGGKDSTVCLHLALQVARERGMVDDGVNQADIMRRLGMEDEEIDRLIDRAGMPSRMARQATDFGKSWVPGE